MCDSVQLWPQRSSHSRFPNVNLYLNSNCHVKYTLLWYTLCIVYLNFSFISFPFSIFLPLFLFLFLLLALLEQKIARRERLLQECLLQSFCVWQSVRLCLSLSLFIHLSLYLFPFLPLGNSLCLSALPLSLIFLQSLGWKTPFPSPFSGNSWSCKYFHRSGFRSRI